MKPLQRALGYLGPYWTTILGAFVAVLLVNAANLVSPLILQIVVDQGITRGDTNALLWSAIALVGVAVVRGVFTFAQSYWSEKASQSAAYDMRNDLFGQISGLSFSYHDQAQTGQLMTRVTSDVEQVRTFLGLGVLQLTSAVVILVGSAIALLLTNWKLALIVLLTIPFTMLVVGRFMAGVRPLFTGIQQKIGALNTVLQENLVGIRVVQAFAREPYEVERYRVLNEDLLDTNLKLISGISGTFPVIFLIANVGTALVIYFGGHDVIGGSLSLGQLVAFNTYLGLMTFPILTIGMIATQITRAAASAQRVVEVLDAHNEVTDRPGAIPLPPVQGRVAFDEVTFRYAGSERPVLDRVSFVAEPGQTVAIVGQTGSGKSTIINLIPRFYDATSGQVTIDEHDVRDVALESLRAQIGIVLQDTTLFSGTIRDNIAYGRPGVSDGQVEAAARAAQADSFIRDLPDGYATIVGERGLGLSGGQRQRLAIARALILDPRILILDDSTSSVDAETEYQIQRALETLMEGRTSFVIAQRISTVRQADLILLLDQGKLVAAGTHDELLRDSALYGEIVDTQLGERPRLDAPLTVGAGKESSR